jgi:hypothetical protein
MIGDQCSHGVKWACQCRECDLVSARELVAHWGNQVDEARRVIAASKRNLFAELTEGMDELKRMREVKA